MSAAPLDDPALDARLRDISARFFVALHGASFGRCDIRVDRDGMPFMLEINPNCGVFYPPSDPGSADLCLAHDPDGHVGFTRQLIRAALARHQKRTTAAPATTAGALATDRGEPGRPRQSGIGGALQMDALIGTQAANDGSGFGE